VKAETRDNQSAVADFDYTSFQSAGNLAGSFTSTAFSAAGGVWHMQTKRKNQLADIATHLEARRADILQAWRAKVDNDPDLTTGTSLSRTQFYDHIPDILDALDERLRAWPLEVSRKLQQQEKEGTASHGLHRWQQGFRLRELTREWGYLQLCLIDEIDAYGTAYPESEPAVIAMAIKALTHVCVAGVSNSADQYWQLDKDEAAGHVRDLEQALALVSALENNRASGWHQATHDLRGGLSMLGLSSSLLSSEELSEPDRVQTTALLQKSVTLLHRMLDDLVALARLDAGQEQRLIAPFDAAELLRDYCTTMQAAAEAQGLWLRYEGPDSLPVEGDRTKVQRIVQNLVLNALRYTKQGGVEVAWASLRENDCDRWVVSVQDTGPGFHGDTGIPMANQITKATQSSHDVEDRAREEGTSTNQDEPAHTQASQSPQHKAHQQAGEGIGLSIVKGLCNLLDATIELETRSGQGSTFSVTFPSHYDK